MKKILVFIITIFFVISSLCSTALALGDLESTKVYVYINDMRVPIVKVGENHYIKINDLKKNGFDVKEDKVQKIINIYQNPNLVLHPFEIDDYITEAFSVTSTKYKVNINDCAVYAKKINNDIAIDINSFINVKGFNFEKWMDNKDNSCDISIRNSYGIENSFTSADKTKIHMTKRGNYFYSGNNRVGLIQDNMEWIALDYITSLIDFDKIIEEKDEYGTWIYLEKGNYEVEIEIDDEGDADAECGPFYMELTAIPFELNGELYLSLIDSVQLFNLEVIKDDETINNKDKSSGYGNFINGMNVIKNNDWFYYINFDDGKSLYRTKQDMSENNKIMDGHVDQFYIDDQKIYYIGYNPEDGNEGIFKSNLDGTNSQQIVSGEVSFLNILGDKLYYCEGLDEGNLCTIDKYGHNKKTLIQGDIAYPNLADGWIYYINRLDNSSIYKAKVDGSYNVKINTRSVNCLNVDSNKVYFSDKYNSYFMNHDGSFENKLFDKTAENILVSENNIFWLSDYDVYKQNKDSTLCDLVYERSEVSCVGLENDMLIALLQNDLTSIQRYDISTRKNDVADIQDCFRIEEVQYPYIYYKKYGGNLHRYNIDTKLSEFIATDFCTVYNIIGDWIYYEGYDGFYRVKTDGTSEMKLLDSNIYDVHVENSGIYYLISQGGMTIEEYCKVNLDGTNKQILIDDLVTDHPFSSQVYKDYIYYGRKDGLYRIKKDGTDKKIVIHQSIWNFKVMDDQIYFYYQGDLYSAESDGSKQEKIIENSGFSYTTYKDNIFYIKESDEYSELYRYNLTSKQSEQVPNMKFSNTFTRFVKEKENNLLISCSKDEGFSEVMSYYLLDMDTNEVSVLQDKIQNCYITSVFINNDNLYYVKEEMETKLIIE